MKLAGALMLAVLAAAAVCQRKAGEKNMPEIRLLEGLKATVMTPAATPIRPGVAAPAPAAAKPGGTGYICPFANAAANSRSSFGLMEGELKPRWSVDLPASLSPRFVLQDRDRVLLYGGEWILLDMQGRTITSGVSAGWPATLDMAHELFYRMISSGHMAAARTADGSMRFTQLPSQGDVFSRRLIVRRGDRILVAGNERALKPLDRGPKAEMRSTVDAVDVAEPIKTSSMGTLRPTAPEKMLYLPSEKIQFAATDQLVAAAAPGRIYIIDWNLQVPRTLEGSFEPLAMSLDETGRIYLVVKREGQADALWLITPEGALVYSFEFPQGTPALDLPPIVAYDHRVYLIAGRQILSLGVDGKLNWTRPTEGPVGGAVALPDGRLLVSEGEWIAVWDAEGKRTNLYRAQGEMFRTAPVPAASGDILAATATHLYCLTARRVGRP